MANPKLDPEDLHYDLVVHALRCPTCWPWRNYLSRVEKLCGTGRALALLYANAELEARGQTTTVVRRLLEPVA